MSTKLKHTPGPWKVERHNSRLEIWSQTTWITSINQDHVGVAPNDAANCRLIAAAPELLNAVRFVLEYYGHKQNDQTLEVLQEALARATDSSDGGEVRGAGCSDEI